MIETVHVLISFHCSCQMLLLMSRLCNVNSTDLMQYCVSIDTLQSTFLKDFYWPLILILQFQLNFFEHWPETSL